MVSKNSREKVDEDRDSNTETTTQKEEVIIVSDDVKDKRENILSAENTSYSEIVSKYKKTLNESEIKEFQKLKKVFSEKGYSDELSGFCAVRKLHDSLK